MSHHPFWKEWMLRQGFEALYGAAVAARVDVLRHNAALGAFAAGHDQFHEHVDYTVSNPSQKDVLAYCSIAFSVVDNNRRIRKLRPDLEAIFPGLIERHFNNSVTAFVMMLRENLTHGRMVMSNWTISRDENGTAGQMLFDVDDLLLFGKWDAMALEYIKVQPHGRVNIGAAISEHFKHLTEFRREIVDFLARNRRADEIDFFEIEDEHRERGYLQSINILVTQIAKGRDPYAYLHRFFSDRECRQIMRYPKHSKVQVDFIIKLKAANAACPDDLREKLYELFGVQSAPTGVVQ